MLRTTLAALALLTAPALADETWTSEHGPLIYEADVGHAAVISFPSFMVNGRTEGPRAQAYVFDLSGNANDRSFHSGYWAMEGPGSCSATMTTPDGITTQRWGRVTVIFDRAAFPTGFTMIVGYCFNDPYIPIRADLN